MVSDREIITKSAQETTQCGQSLARSLTHQPLLIGETGLIGHIVCLYGDLGSGKTTFARGFARGLGITSRLLSPTFIIVRRYSIPKSSNYFYHIDLYRVNSPQDEEELGLLDILNHSTSYVLVEWAQHLGSLLPPKRIDIHFSVDTSGSHKIIMKNIIEIV